MISWPIHAVPYPTKEQAIKLLNEQQDSVIDDIEKLLHLLLSDGVSVSSLQITTSTGVGSLYSDSIGLQLQMVVSGALESSFSQQRSPHSILDDTVRHLGDLITRFSRTHMPEALEGANAYYVDTQWEPGPRFSSYPKSGESSEDLIDKYQYDRRESVIESSTSFSPKRVVIDPSLIVHPFHNLVESMLDDNQIKLLATRDMYDFLFLEHGKGENMPRMLEWWGAGPSNSKVVANWMRNMVRERQLSRNIEVLDLNPFYSSVKQSLLSQLENHVSSDTSICDFIADEVCLSLQYRQPIWCVETSSWKFVNALKKIGVKIMRKIIQHAQMKKEYFQEYWKEALGSAGRSAFLYLFHEPITTPSCFVA